MESFKQELANNANTHAGYIPFPLPTDDECASICDDLKKTLVDLSKKGEREHKVCFLTRCITEPWEIRGPWYEYYRDVPRWGPEFNRHWNANVLAAENKLFKYWKEISGIDLMPIRTTEEWKTKQLHRYGPNVYLVTGESVIWKFSW
jgi:hypothetical protein